MSHFRIGVERESVRPRRSVASRVFKVGVAVKEIRDNLEHRLEETVVVPCFTSEKSDALGFQRTLSLLLVLDAAILPC